MAIPIRYNLRNLVVRKTSTLMTALGIALTVAVLVADLALVNGLRTAFEASGDPLHVLVMRKGATAEVSSIITPEIYQDLRSKAGVAGASLEMVTVISLPSVDSPRGMNITVRALAAEGIAMRRIRIGEGRWFQPGRREVVVGKSVAKRYPRARLGSRLRFGRGEWEVVGVTDGGDSATDSEIWGDLNQIAAGFNRQQALSSVLVKAAYPAAVPALIHSLEDDRRLNVSAISERAYYESQTSAGAPVQFLGMFVAAIMAVGSCFAAMNTMYAAVARRAREIGTLRVLGFSRGGILLSFLVESVLLSLTAGVLGCLLALPLNGITTGVGSFVTFSEFAFRFRVTPSVMIPGIAFAVIVGAVGGLLPARMAARKEILTALREI